MLRLMIACLCLPFMAEAQSLKQSLLGTWSGSGSVQIRPTSSAKATRCKAQFAEVSGFWLGGSLSCSQGKRLDLIQLRFAEPDTKGRMVVEILDDDGDALVSLKGQLSDARLTLYHPEMLEFSGTEYQPVMLFSMPGFDQFQLHQLGVPTRSNAQRYTMSDLLFDRAE